MPGFNERDVNIKSYCLKIIKIVKQTIKKHRYSRNPIIKHIVSTLYFFKNAYQTMIRLCMDSDFRSIILMQFLKSKDVHQTTSLTFMNRYPTIFSACRDYFDNNHDIKILSYGCSTGEEVLTLRNYFPTSHIIGAEINKRSLAICRKHPVDDKIKFIYSTPDEIKKHGPFDAIFCMAVLQRKPHHIKAEGINNLKKIYPFEKFEMQIIELDKLINPKGLLIVHFTQYSLLDTTIAPKYKAYGHYNQDGYVSPVFDKNSNLIQNPPQQNTIFIKLHN